MSMWGLDLGNEEKMGEGVNWALHAINVGGILHAIIDCGH